MELLSRPGRGSAGGTLFRSGQAPRVGGPRIALLTPYTGNNLGDAATQDSMIANIRARLPEAEFSGISLSDENFVRQHGGDAFPLCGTDRPFHGMSREGIPLRFSKEESHGRQPRHQAEKWALLKGALKRIPLLGRGLKRLHTSVVHIGDELRHCLRGYRFIRNHELLIVSGGGQLDDEWGGAWGHPFALFKWAVLSRIARVTVVFTSVGACKVTGRTSRFLLSSALRLSQYRSYRDKRSKQIAMSLLQRTVNDPVVPDLAFSLPPSELPPPAGIRGVARGRTMVAVSPIAYAKPGSWPSEDRAVYERYTQETARVIAQLLEQQYFVVIVWSALSDKKVVSDVIERLDATSKTMLDRQMLIPEIASWRDLVSILRDVDLLVASRLHSVILGFIAATPTLAISFDPKVDWAMEDLGQTDYLLQIQDFVAADVVDALDRLEFRKQSIRVEISAYRQRILSESAPQYDTLARIADESFGYQSKEVAH